MSKWVICVDSRRRACEPLLARAQRLVFVSIGGLDAAAARERDRLSSLFAKQGVRRTAELAQRWSCTGSARARGQRARCELGCDGRLRSMAATPTRSQQLYRRFAPLHRATHLVDALRPGGSPAPCRCARRLVYSTTAT